MLFFAYFIIYVLSKSSFFVRFRIVKFHSRLFENGYKKFFSYTCKCLKNSNIVLIFLRYNVQFQIAIMYGDPMILRPFRILTFVKKDVTPPFLKKRQLFLSFTSFSSFKRHNFFSFTSARLSAQLSARLSAKLSAQFLMLPNLTNHYIKLSDGDLQCE